MTAKETIAITALIQALVAKLYKLRSSNMNWIVYKRPMINENKWRASRFGLDGKLIDFGKEEEVPTRDLIHEMLNFVDDVVDELGCRWALDYIPEMMEKGTGADRQLKVYEETNDFKKLVDYIMEETLNDI
jgi:carboxylate-amine ligase